jgi:Na+-transporting methylmalonyl-CoA/oxaloacetate decarboxylase gamma subunit
MDDVMDRIWAFIEAFLNNTVVFLDNSLTPLETLGPGVVIFVLSFLVVLFTRAVSRVYVTQRSVKLEKEYRYWRGIREEAMKHPVREKGKALAKNVDQAQLNRAYYDYFFEGMLKHFLVNVLPILLMVSYVTKVYTPQTLLQRFGEPWIFSFSLGASAQVNVSSMLWLVICFVLSFILFAVLKMVFKKRYARKKSI